MNCTIILNQFKTSFGIRIHHTMNVLKWLVEDSLLHYKSNITRRDDVNINDDKIGMYQLKCNFTSVSTFYTFPILSFIPSLPSLTCCANLLTSFEAKKLYSGR